MHLKTPNIIKIFWGSMITKQISKQNCQGLQVEEHGVEALRYDNQTNFKAEVSRPASGGAWGGGF